MGKKTSKKTLACKKKKTRIGNSKFTKYHNRGGGEKGSTTSKNYKKRYRGQGRG